MHSMIKYERDHWRLGMVISVVDVAVPTAERVVVTDDTLTIECSDGRSLSVPLAWFPRLLHATRKERSNWRLIGKGRGIHWSDIDEDISIDGLLAGKPSGESQASFDKWLRQRAASRASKSRAPERVARPRRSSNRPSSKG
jgi:Protein of unknown function (DUF2442)